MSAPNDQPTTQTLPSEQSPTPPGQQPPSPETAPPPAPTQPASPTAPGPPPGAPPPAPRQRSPLSFVQGFLTAILLLGLIAAALSYLGLGQSVLPQTRETATVTTQAATPTLAPTATPTERIIYQDSLTTAGSSTGWSNDPACAFKPDGLHVIGLFTCFAPPDALADGTVSVTLKPVSGATNKLSGIVFRRMSTGNYYLAQIDGLERWSLDKVVNGAHTSLVAPQSSPAIRMGLGASNTLTVQMVGGRFTIAANGTPLGSATDATFASGLIGLAGNGDGDVVFTNLTITAPRT